MISERQDYVNNPEVPFKPRKRFVNTQHQRRFINKEKVQKGLAHVSQSGKIIAPKSFQGSSSCKCGKRCVKKISMLRQFEIFSDFYKMPNWSSKTLFIRGCISRRQVEENNFLPGSTNRNRYTYKYCLVDSQGISQQVCQKIFCKCLQVNSGRVYRAVESSKLNAPAIDNRGRAPSKNKTKDADKEFVCEFINRFPRYESHYGRSTSNKQYLSPNLNAMKLFREYELICNFEKRKPVSQYMFRHIFNTEFNLTFKRNKKDTCKTCDEINKNLKSKQTTIEKHTQEKRKKKKHHQAVKRKKDEFKMDIEEAKKSGGKILCFTFDLQKT